MPVFMANNIIDLILLLLLPALWIHPILLQATAFLEINSNAHLQALFLLMSGPRLLDLIMPGLCSLIMLCSHLLYFTPHISMGADEAVSAKLCFELLSSGYNRQIKYYQTDNGVFVSKSFCQHCLKIISRLLTVVLMPTTKMA
jgi:hypothetical protein